MSRCLQHEDKPSTSWWLSLIRGYRDSHGVSVSFISFVCIECLHCFPRSCTTYDYSIPLCFGGNSIGCTIQPSLSMHPWYPCTAPFHRLRVSLILGAEGASSGAAMTGGLVASGEGTWSELWPKPRELLRLGVNGGGLPADPDAAAPAGVGVAGGCAPELNSAQRGHLRFVSASEKKKGSGSGSVGN
jgi:hypothetical protein